MSPVIMANPVFDVDHYLASRTLTAQARRLGIHRMIDLPDLPDVLRKLMENGLVSRGEASGLLEELCSEGLLRRELCRHFISK